MVDGRRFSRTLAVQQASRPVGRPVVGPQVRISTPLWAITQIDALCAGDWGSDTRSGVYRDLVILGLLTLKERGLQCDGFDPAAAIRQALVRGESTGTALDPPTSKDKAAARAAARAASTPAPEQSSPIEPGDAAE